MTIAAAAANTSRKQPAAPGSHLAIDASQLGSIETLPTQAANLEGAAHGATAATQSAASMPGYSPGAGLAGSMLGILIANSIQNSSIRKAANKPIEPLRAVYAAYRQELGLEDSLAAAWNTHTSELQRCAADVATKCETRLTLRPALRLLANARILCVSIEAKLQDRKARPVYATRLNYLSQPAAPTQIDELNEYWSRDDFRSLTQEWSSALQTLMPLLAAEIERGGKTAPGDSQAIRYVNAGGLFYDRGTILSQDEGRVVYRSLDGGISAVYVDRFVGTEEYYQWLTAPPGAASAPVDAASENAEARQ